MQLGLRRGDEIVVRNVRYRVVNPNCFGKIMAVKVESRQQERVEVPHAWWISEKKRQDENSRAAA